MKIFSKKMSSRPLLQLIGLSMTLSKTLSTTNGTVTEITNTKVEVKINDNPDESNNNLNKSNKQLVPEDIRPF